MKTAVTVLQEMMVKMGQTPDYECIAQSGPQHQAMFKYRCSASGAVVTASARSKKEAKQEAARCVLRALAAAGHAVAAPYGLHDPAPTPAPCAEDDADAGGAAGCSGGAAGAAGGGAGAAGAGAVRSYVALLQELCVEYRLPGAEAELVGDTGPPHLRHFTVSVRVGQHSRLATATTKKAARQLAAQELYLYLRENLARLTEDFVEDEALVRAHERAMERYLEARDERRPDLGQPVGLFHRGVATRAGPEARHEALLKLESGGPLALPDALGALGLQAECSTLAAGGPGGPGGPGGSGGPGGDVLHVLTLPGATPALAFAGRRPAAAEAALARYLRRALRQEPEDGTRAPLRCA